MGLVEKHVFLEMGFLEVVLSPAGQRVEEKDCPVCLELLDPLSLEARVGVIVACGHVFHDECLRVWLEEKNTCPVCRKRLFVRQRQRTVFDDVEGNPYYVLQVGDTRELEWMGVVMRRLVAERVRVFVEKGGRLEGVRRG